VKRLKYFRLPPACKAGECTGMERKITALKVQKRDPNRVNVYLDGEFAFGLTKIVAAWLQVGQVLSSEKISSLQSQETLEVAYLKALHYLSYRPRSESEVESSLKEKGFDEGVIAYVLERLKQDRYLGDEQFAQLWVENRSSFRPRSRRMLRYELRQKGVSEENISNALDGAEEESSLAYQAAARYASRLKDEEWDTFRKRLAAFLARRGFSYGTISPVVRTVWTELHAEEQET
jgi:regulatory protein